MKNSLILQTTTRLLVPLMLLFSLFLLHQGHHAPGGGFSGGLVAAAAFTLYAIAYGFREVYTALPLRPITFAGIGLTTALASALIPMLTGMHFLSGKWSTIHLGSSTEITLGTPLLFDVGVYLIVLGATLSIILPLEETTTVLSRGTE